MERGNELEAMVRTVESYRVRDKRVLEAVSKVRRHAFIPERCRSLADPYGDYPVPIGYGQTISQPFIVAYMTERLGLQPGEKVLEVGTGSGYQAAILAELGAEVYTVELVPELAEHARRVLDGEGYARVHTRVGDGHLGWPEEAPFDAIILTCAPKDIPESLTRQLAEGGRMILPVGTAVQQLVLLRNVMGEVREEADIMVRFVPMVHGKDLSGRTPDGGTAGDEWIDEEAEP